ncbi:MAG: tetratricopeptide repeat protein [Candidatus Kapabacteria bacterium]|nr:tetratricopeptide repeat protein [Candidatus Kapabacteria bacterium]
MKFKYIIVIATITFLISCRPVRNGMNYSVSKNIVDQNSNKVVESEPAVKNESNSANKLQPGRFSDTTIIRLPETLPGKYNFLDETLKLAYTDYYGGSYQSSYDKFKLFSETIITGFPVFYESIFYQAECSLKLNKIEDAEAIYMQLINSNNIPSDFIEQSLVELGKINCSKGQATRATEYFERLKKNYPNSQYLKIAKCDN